MPREVAENGWVEVNPAFAGRLAALGLNTAAGFLDLPGEVVCGHPDRHVARVVLPCGAFYLKRQHAVTWRERLRNRCAGFGWASRCGREAELLKQLAAGGFPAPRWAAHGEDGRGRAFLMVEEVAGAADLRRILRDTELSLDERVTLADRLGGLIARLHAAGFTTPDLTAKHVLISADLKTITLIDWQSSRRGVVSTAERVRAFAALHASVPAELASPRERLRVLQRTPPLARRVANEAARFRGRRSVRDQLQSAPAQRLVWVAGEAVCAIPDVAAVWPRPAIAAPFYGCESGTLRIRLPDGREGMLIRGRSFAPLGRLKAKLRGRPWRSPGATLGRVLFHLERYGVPAPRLLAFGQRFIGSASAEWFALHTPPSEPLTEVEPATVERLGRWLRLLHDAGCRPVGDPLAAFGESGVRDVTRVRIVRRLSERHRGRDLADLVASLPTRCRPAAEAGYAASLREPEPCPRNDAAGRPLAVAL